MAGFNFDSIKSGLNKFTDSFRQPADNSARNDQYDETAYDDQYEGDYQENYEEGYAEEDLYSEQGNENEYAADSYEDDGYDETNYGEVNYDEPYEEDDYASADYDQEDREDGYQEGEYDEAYDAEYASGEAYDDYDDEEDLGYNPAVFENLNDEQESYDDRYEDTEYDDDLYEDVQYDDNGTVYEYDSEYYEEDAYQDEDEQPSAVGAVVNSFLNFILTNDIAMYVSLVILPPLGIWLLWRKNKFDITVRSAISVASLIWLVVLIILLFSRGGDDDMTSNPPVDFLNHTTTPAVTATVQPTVPLTQPTQPAATPNTGLQNPGVTNPQNTVSAPTSYVYVDNNGLHYHNLENCGGMTGASKITLDTATSRGKTACPVCVGGGVTTNPNGSALPTGTQYYATERGTWYHTNSSCQGMTGASVVTEANAIATGKTACPECIGYYGTPGGKYYHSISNCSSMKNAITNTEAEWIKTGKTACPECVTSDKKVGSTVNKDTTQVYATENGTYYHTIKDCSGMKDASLISIQSAVSSKKAKCPRCVSPSRVTVFGTSGGKYYHTKSTCSGMKNAVSVTAEFAIKNGKEACPTCASMFLSSSSSNLSNTTTTTGSTGTGFEAAESTVYVYATDGGTYMHLKSNCSGMANAKKVTFQQAVNAKKAVCPDCLTPAKLNVFATDGGKWFHTVSDCQGMKNAVTLTAKKAMDFGKTACPVCAKALSSSATTSGNSTSGSTNNNSSNSFTGNSSNTNTTFTTDNGSTSKPTTGSASSTVYIISGKTYYHVGARCSAQGVSGANAVTLEYAIERDYKACPSCNPPSRISY